MLSTLANVLFPKDKSSPTNRIGVVVASIHTKKQDELGIGEGDATSGAQAPANGSAPPRQSTARHMPEPSELSFHL